MTDDHAPDGPATDRGDALVVLGLTGDLGEQKLFAAIVELVTTGALRGPVLGVGRREHTGDDLWEMLVEATDLGDEGLDDLREALDLDYVTGDATERDTWERIAERLGDVTTPVVYLAIPPDLFAGVAEQVAASSLPDTTRLVVEKPFGHDVESACALHESITAEIDVERLFLVDHFLAKPAVENLVVLRSANPMIEAALDRDAVERIEFTMSEAFGVADRADFYDGVGAIEDVVQNHMLQALAVLLMEVPEDDSADAFDRCRAKALESIRPIDPSVAVVGRYAGYLDHDGVDHDSATETFLAAPLTVDHPRWDGVDVVLRTGKEMAVTATELVVVFRRPERADGSGGDGGDPPNLMRIEVKPESRVRFEIGVLDADTHGRAARWLDACGPGDHGELSDYATMLDSALQGERRHFARLADTVAAWTIVQPLIDTQPEPVEYERGSYGPEAADALVPGGWTPLRVAVDGAAD